MVKCHHIPAGRRDNTAIITIIYSGKRSIYLKVSYGLQHYHYHHHPEFSTDTQGNGTCRDNTVVKSHNRRYKTAAGRNETDTATGRAYISKYQSIQ